MHFLYLGYKPVGAGEAVWFYSLIRKDGADKVTIVSPEQKHFLNRLKKLAKKDYRIFAWEFRHYINQIRDDVQLDPEWLELWKKHKTITYKCLSQDDIEFIEKRLDKIKPFDEEIKNLKISKDTKITFLLGAGASAPSGIPTVENLLPELWTRAAKIGRDDLDQLSEWCNKRNITNIEDLLTAAYISDFAAKNRAITSLLNYFLFSRGQELEEDYRSETEVSENIRPDVSSISFLQDTLQTLFGLLTSTMISASPNASHQEIVKLIKEHEHTAIITTNYDGCMDEAILNAGMTIEGTIANKKNTGSKAVNLIKMHGSINWAYCDSCQRVKEFNLLELKKIYEQDRLSFPVIGICRHCQGLRRPLLVPPLSFKFIMFPDLIEIWNLARQKIDEADYLIVVGYSFAEADTYITKIISGSMSRNKNQKMIVVNPDPNLVPALRKRFSAQIDDFDEKRILKACEDCEKAVPEIIESMLANKETNKPISPVSKEEQQETPQITC